MDEKHDIARIVAKDVLGEFKYEVVFGGGPERMRVIYAPNGRGKTNFLRAVSYALTPTLESLQALIEIPIRVLEIDFESGASLKIERKDAFSPSYASTARPPEADARPAQITVEPADFAGRLYRRVWDDRHEYTRYQELVGSFSGGSILMGDERLASAEDKDSPRSPAAASPDRRRIPTVSRLLDRVERMLTQGALDSLSRESQTSGVYADITRTTLTGSQGISATTARSDLEIQIGELLLAGSGLEKYALLSLRQVRDIKAQLDTVRSNDRNLPTLHKILKPYLDSLKDQVESLAPAYELIDTFVTAVNEFLDRKRLSFSASRGIQLHGRGSTILHPENLSSGERHLLLLLSVAVLATEERPLVIIDEPELSLGIGWQRQLLRQLLRCSSSANVQFLIASHSVQVMGEIGGEAVIQPDEG